VEVSPDVDECTVLAVVTTAISSVLLRRAEEIPESSRLGLCVPSRFVPIGFWVS
jgi:hypothetical protein